MVYDAMRSFTRVFTIHFENELYCASIDCRRTPTLRDLFITALPIPAPPASSTSTATVRKHTDTWVDACICTSGGQRLSLALSTEIAPAVLQVGWATRPVVTPGELFRGSSVVKQERTRQSEAVKMEDGSDDDGCSSISNSEEEDVRQLRSHPYWYHGRHKTNDEDKRQGDDMCNLTGSTTGGHHKESIEENNESDNDNEEDEEEDDNNADGDDGGDYDSDARHFEAVLPVVVGGVVRLVNTESRDKSHEWTVYVRGLFNENHYLAQCIESVCFILDPSFTPSERLVTAAPFELTEVGWGEFLVRMKVQLRHYPRPIQVSLSSSRFKSMSSPIDAQLAINMASEAMSLHTGMPLAGITRGPVISPVIDVLSHNRYYSSVNTNPPHHRNHHHNDNGVEDKTGSQSQVSPALWTLETCPGIVMLSHSLRFSHRPRRGHCVPPLGRPYEPEEHIGYTMVHVPVVTEQYDEIAIPDPPPALREVAGTLPDMLRRRIAIVKAARAMSVTQQHSLGLNSGPPFRAATAFNEKGVSCWKYIMQEEPDDAVLAEAYLDSVAATRHVAEVSQLADHQNPQQHSLLGADPALVVKPGRGRKKLTGAEIDLSALRAVKKALLEAIEKMRREIVLRQAVHVSHQFT